MTAPDPRHPPCRGPLRMTGLQMLALLACWPRLKRQPPPNCTQMLLASHWHWKRYPRHDGSYRFWNMGQLVSCLNRLQKKGVLRSWHGPGLQRFWAPGPLSDYLQEQGVLLP